MTVTVPGLFSGLTHRDLLLIRLIAEDRDRQGIADELGISINTVKSHLKRIGRVLGVDHQAAMVAWAFREGYLG